jgi:hypothetical protein
MSVRLALQSAAKSNEKLVNQKYATIFLSWLPFKNASKFQIWQGSKCQNQKQFM